MYLGRSSDLPQLYAAENGEKGGDSRIVKRACQIKPRTWAPPITALFAPLVPNSETM